MPKPSKRALPHHDSFGSALSAAQGDIESLKEEMNEWYNNLPESFQNGGKGEALQEASEQLETALDHLNEAEHSLSSVEHDLDTRQVTYTQDHTRKSRSRNGRLSNVSDIVAALITAASDLEHEHEDKPIEGLEELLGNLRDAEDAMSSVDFPGMY